MYRSPPACSGASLSIPLGITARSSRLTARGFRLQEQQEDVAVGLRKAGGLIGRKLSTRGAILKERAIRFRIPRACT